MENQDLDTRLARLIAQEVVLEGLLAAIAWFFWNQQQAIAILYGGAVVVINTLLLGARVRSDEQNPVLLQARLMGGAIQRFIFTLASMAAAFAWFKLPIGGIVIGLLAGNFIFFMHAARQGPRYGEDSL